RKAVEWQDTIKVKKGKGFEEVKCTFRKTHHGPILEKRSETEYVSAMIGKLYDALLSRQTHRMMKARSFEELRAALDMQDFHIFNQIYADQKWNIFYLYNGIVPRRDPSFDWSHPVDGSDPRTEWQGLHSVAELPQVFNPASGYVQNCNSTPYTTTDDAGP